MLLASYPEGMPVPDNWVMDAQAVPDPGPGQILIKSKWLSVDPYMRGRMSPASTYAKGVALGAVMQGAASAKWWLPTIRRGKLATLPNP